MNGTIVLIEDYPITRKLLASALINDGFAVIGEAESIARADELLAATKPDLAIIDLILIDGDTTNHLGRWMSEHPDMRFIILSAHSDDVTLYALSSIGITCHVSKRSGDYGQLCCIAKTLLKGERIYSRHISAAVIRFRRDCLSRLTKTELGLVEMLGVGMPDDEIAVSAGCSPATVRTHRANIMRKLHITSRTDLMRWVFRAGFTRRRLALNALRSSDSPETEAWVA